MLKSDLAINSRSYQNDFGPFEGKIWLNSASEGALPRVSYESLLEVGQWKLKPFELTHERFAKVPQELKRALGQLLKVDPQDIILGNSATYGIQLLAQGLPLQVADEVLLMQNDFPTDILPWLPLQEQGIKIRQIPSSQAILQPAEVFSAITPATKIICLPHVHTFSGHVLDVKTIGEFCRQRAITFILNVSQSVGYWPVDLSFWPVDAVVCAGFKWLCGPYGTGFCWIRPTVRETMRANQSFWVNMMTPEELGSTGELKFKRINSAKAYDVPGTANFFNFVPWTRSILYLLDIGIPTIHAVIDRHVQKLNEGLQKLSYPLISQTQPGQRSALVVFSHQQPDKNIHIYRQLTASGIFVASWKGLLRISPHIYNTEAEVDQTLSVLKALAT